MDERAINGAAIEAINDLQLDCEIKNVCQSSGDEWCIGFSGKYGTFCDGFKNQFGKESSSQVIREKIKGYLIKQVHKIRSKTGRRRKPAIIETQEKREQESGILAAPLKIVGELFDRAASIAGVVVSQASSVAETARETVVEAAANITPVTIEVRSTKRAVKKTASKRPSKSTAKKATKATKRASRKVGKQAGKTVKAAKKRKS